MNNEATSICALRDECNQVLFAIFHKHLRNDNCQAERKRGAHFQGANNECHPRFSIKRQVDLIVIIIVVAGAESVHWLTSRALVRRRETMREGGDMARGREAAEVPLLGSSHALRRLDADGPRKRRGSLEGRHLF